MANFTHLVQPARQLTEAEDAQRTAYVNAQISAGTTDGNLYSWAYGIDETGKPISNQFRIWTSEAAANGMRDLYAGFTPPMTVKVY
jgi:hypothetical protein